MNLFNKAKESKELQDKGKKKCFHCNKDFLPDKRNLNRGWGLFCSKSCSTRHLNDLRSLGKQARKKGTSERKKISNFIEPILENSI